MESSERSKTEGETEQKKAMQYLLKRHSNDRFHIASYIEITHDLQSTGFQVSFEHIENQVGRRFMRNALVTKTVQIKFQAFELNNFLIRCVNNPDSRKIGIA